jgi:hypothetical protein
LAYFFQAHNAGDQLLVPAIPTAYCATEVHDNFEASSARRAIACPRDDHKRNESALRSLSRSACETRHRSTRHGTRIIALASRHSVADYSSGLVARGATRIILLVRAPARQKTQLRPLECRNGRTPMSETEQREIAVALFPRQTREEIRDAIKLEEERRAALVKNLYRLRALRLSRNRGSVRIQEG